MSSHNTVNFALVTMFYVQLLLFTILLFTIHHSMYYGTTLAACALWEIQNQNSRENRFKRYST